MTSALKLFQSLQCDFCGKQSKHFKTLFRLQHHLKYFHSHELGYEEYKLRLRNLRRELEK